MATISEKMTAIANAIRTKTGGTGTLNLDGMANALNNIPERGTNDLTASGATVTVPAGNYASQATKSIAKGLMGSPMETSVSTTGLVSITPSLDSPGYMTQNDMISSTYQLNTQAGKTVIPSTSVQTAVEAGRYTTGAVKVSAIPSVEMGPGDISVNSSGLITAQHYIDSPGYITQEQMTPLTLQLTTQAAKTITPSSSSQTAVAKDVYTTGVVTVGAIPSEYKNINTLTTQLYNSLKYSGFITSSMTFDQICAKLLKTYPELVANFLTLTASTWTKEPSMEQLTTPTVTLTSGSEIIFKTFKMNADLGYVDFRSKTFIPRATSVLQTAGNFASQKQLNYKAYIYIVTNGTYTKLATYGVSNTSFNKNYDLSSYAGKNCQIVVREESGWKKSNSDWTTMTFTNFKVT